MPLMQSLYCRARIRRHDTEQCAGRTSWPRALLFPILQSTQVDADERGKLRLRHVRHLSNLADVWIWDFRYPCAFNFNSAQVGTHLAYAADELCKFPLIHRSTSSIINAAS